MSRPDSARSRAAWSSSGRDNDAFQASTFGSRASELSPVLSLNSYVHFDYVFVVNGEWKENPYNFLDTKMAKLQIYVSTCSCKVEFDQMHPMPLEIMAFLEWTIQYGLSF